MTMTTTVPMRLQRARTDADRGSMAIWVCLVALVALLGMGLIVDGAGKVAAGRRAQVVAAEAARAAGQELSGSLATGRHDIDPGRAVIAARSYLRATGVEGTVRVSGDVITVTTSVRWEPRMLPGPGKTLTGTATARRTDV